MTDQEKRQLVEKEEQEKKAQEYRPGLWAAAKETFTKFNDKDGMTQAAALAFYSGLSLAPILTVLAWIMRNVLHTDAKESLIGAFENVIGARAAAPIREILDPASQQAQVGMTFAGIVSLGILAFTATGVFAQLQTALNHMWDVRATPAAGMWGYLRKRILSFGMLLSILFLLLISLIASAAIEAFVGMTHLEQGWLLSALNTVVSLVIFTGVFAALFKWVPDAKIAWRDVWFGAALSAVMFVIGKYLLGLYLGRGSYESSYGAAVGSFVALLVWVYYSSIIVFAGAEAAQVYTRRHGHRIKPEEHAVKVEQTRKPVPA